MIHRLRRRHREWVRDDIAQTVTTASVIDDTSPGPVSIGRAMCPEYG
jgi:hypothetical protein